MPLNEAEKAVLALISRRKRSRSCPRESCLDYVPPIPDFVLNQPSPIHRSSRIHSNRTRTGPSNSPVYTTSTEPVNQSAEVGVTAQPGATSSPTVVPAPNVAVGVVGAASDRAAAESSIVIEELPSGDEQDSRDTWLMLLIEFLNILKEIRTKNRIWKTLLIVLGIVLTIILSCSGTYLTLHHPQTRLYIDRSGEDLSSMRRFMYQAREMIANQNLTVRVPVERLLPGISSPATTPQSPTQTSDPIPSIEEIEFPKSSCHNFKQFFLCVDLKHRRCILVFSTYPERRFVSVMKFSDAPPLSSQSERTKFSTLCPESETVYKYLPYV